MKFINKKQTIRPQYRLFIKVRDKSKPIMIDELNRPRIPVIWKEVNQVNLGSVKIPNKDIFEIRYEPIFESDENDDKMF